MGLGPDVWGPHGWKFIHFVALGYPKNPTNEDKENYKLFFKALPNVLPCSICKVHFNQNAINNPLTDEILEDRIKLLNWTIDLHNEVNKINNKKNINYNEGLNLLLNNFKDSSESVIDNKDIEACNNGLCNKKVNINNKISDVDNKISDVNNKISDVNNKISDVNDKYETYQYYFIILAILVIGILYLHYYKKK
jgi:hypothetical protein